MLLPAGTPQAYRDESCETFPHLLPGCVADGVIECLLVEGRAASAKYSRGWSLTVNTPAKPHGETSKTTSTMVSGEVKQRRSNCRSMNPPEAEKNALNEANSHAICLTQTQLTGAPDAVWGVEHRENRS